MPNPGSAAGTLGDPTLAMGGPGVFGGGSFAISTEGNIARQIKSVAAMVTPSTTAADIVVAVVSIPAGSLDADGRGLSILAQGMNAATANVKTAKLWFNPTTAVINAAIVGGTLLATTGALASNGTAWQLTGKVFKRGGSNTNTQTTSSGGAIVGIAHVGISNAVDTTAVEGAPILVAVTINNATAANDSGLTLLQIDGIN